MIVIIIILALQPIIGDASNFLLEAKEGITVVVLIIGASVLNDVVREIWVP